MHWNKVFHRLDDSYEPMWRIDWQPHFQKFRNGWVSTGNSVYIHFSQEIEGALKSGNQTDGKFNAYWLIELLVRILEGLSKSCVNIVSDVVHVLFVSVSVYVQVFIFVYICFPWALYSVPPFALGFLFLSLFDVHWLIFPWGRRTTSLLFCCCNGSRLPSVKLGSLL